MYIRDNEGLRISCGGEYPKNLQTEDVKKTKQIWKQMNTCGKHCAVSVSNETTQETLCVPA